MSPGTDKYLWGTRSHGLCDFHREGKRYKEAVFQHHFPYTATDILCLAGKGAAEPDRKRMDAVYPPVPVFVPVRNIEVSYYEQKTFWSLCAYMVRSRKGIEMLVNLINISYCAMKLLPYMEETLSQYKGCSVQEFRFALSEQIRRQIFYINLVQHIETQIKSMAIIKALRMLCLRETS